MTQLLYTIYELAYTLDLLGPRIITTLVIESCEYMDDGDSDIEKDPAFPLLQSDDEEEFMQEPMPDSLSHISSPTCSHL